MYKTKLNEYFISLVEISHKTKKFSILRVNVTPIAPMTAMLYIRYSATI